MSTFDTAVTQPFQTQQPSPRNYDPLPLPSQYSTQTTPHNSTQQGFSNTNGTNTLQVHSGTVTHFQTTTQLRQPILHTYSYTPVQTTQNQNIQPGLTINTLHSNTLSNHNTQEIFLDFHCKLFLIAHFRTVLRVQIPVTHNTLRQLIINKTILILPPHLNHIVYHKM